MLEESTARNSINLQNRLSVVLSRNGFEKSIVRSSVSGYQGIVIFEKLITRNSINSPNRLSVISLIEIDYQEFSNFYLRNSHLSTSKRRNIFHADTLEICAID